jgi:hypothetical protein
MLLSHLYRRSLLMVIALAIAAPLLLASARTAHAAPPPPTPETCPAVRVDSVDLVRTVNGPALQIQGVKPHADTRVHLVAEDVAYVIAPEYWTYFVLGCGGTGPVTKNPFRTVLPITGPIGRCGIVIPPHHIDIDADGDHCPPTS